MFSYGNQMFICKTFVYENSKILIFSESYLIYNIKYDA